MAKPASTIRSRSGVVVEAGPFGGEAEKGAQGTFAEFEWMERERIGPITAIVDDGGPVASPVRFLESQ
jgi:hypothetical protein